MPLSEKEGLLEPNPNYARVPFKDIALTLIFFMSIPWRFLCWLFFRIFTRSNPDRPPSFLTDCWRSFARAGTANLPISTTRALFRMPASTILDSPRFRSLTPRPCVPVQTPHLAGMWIVRGTPDPADSDLVFFVLHGGAFVVGEPTMNAVNMLRMAELANERGTSSSPPTSKEKKHASTSSTSTASTATAVAEPAPLTISIFSLDYSLAPETRFPAPIDEAEAAYTYLLHKMRIPAAKLAIYGESAGAHIALALLLRTRLTQPRPGGGLFLVAPWLSLLNGGASFERNRHRDTLIKEALDFATDVYVGGAGGRAAAAGQLDFGDALDAAVWGDGAQRPAWDAVLPPRTYVSCGGDEVLVDDALRFAARARADGAVVEVEVEQGASHAWQGMMDALDIPKYLKMAPGEAVPVDMMRGTRILTDAILRGR
ncbi:Alpha/Beta hydrolase protein [Phyllosticta citrichinensis]|uniref:Alpha/Beta hydrolase protein n=1 Tax=Phyllosticta citrichinensis TaxID=1130410 RepID=A0ABR1Y571_9PEZI